MDRFYTPVSPADGSITIEGDQFHHIHAVKRHGNGDTIILFDGSGNEYECVIEHIDKHSLIARVVNTYSNAPTSNVDITIASAIPKAKRADVMVGKLAELGVKSLTFMTAIRSVTLTKPGSNKAEKWERISIESSKQCGRADVMHIEVGVPYTDIVKEADAYDIKILLHPSGVPLREVLEKESPPASILVCVGPEGGFTEDEIKCALSNGFTSGAVSPFILRIETACICAASAIGYQFYER